MRRMQLALIVALSENDCIGRDGDLPWRLPDDLKRFKRLTLGSPIIMGRKTCESIGRPLPGRTNIVVTRQRGYGAEGCVVVGSLDEAHSKAKATGAEQAYVIGGADLYRLALPICDTLHLTRVHAQVDGDTFFPSLDWSLFAPIETEEHPADAAHAHAYTFETWQRRR